MCGVCGIYTKGTEKVSRKTLERMRDVMVNRGPDDAGIYIADHIGLGHRRLSIIDLSPAGHQPLSNEDRTIWLVFNGEIYNFIGLRKQLIRKGHIFRSGTDAEVLVHGYEEWGLDELLEKINGMFAFAIWDADKEICILVRDRVGVKPLFYLEVNGKVYFSSDIKSVWLAHNEDLQVNYEAMQHFLYSYCIPQEYSIFNGVKKVLPAHYIIFDKSKAISNNYWKLSFATKEIYNEEEFITATENNLKAAVKRRMISDVPLGAFLSGGVDSSLVVAMMAQLSDRPVKTFSIGFHEDSYNELKYARMVAEYYATEHHEFVVKPDALSILPEIVWSYGEPFADSSQIPTYYVAKMTREHVTVALTGDGGDESFAGYENIVAQYYGSKYRKLLPAVVRNNVLPAMANSLVAAVARRGFVSKVKTLTEFGRGEFCDSLENGGVFNHGYLKALYSEKFKSILSAHEPKDIYFKYGLAADGLDEVDKALFVDIKTRLPNDYLTKVDVATMMNSLEARSPFLDYKLVEFAAKIPSSVKVKHGQQKYLLKKLAAMLLPYDAVYRKKWGFGIPIGFWFRGRLQSVIKETLLSERALSRGYFSEAFVKQLIGEHVLGVKDHTHRLWTLLNLELWHQMFIDKVITANSSF